MKCGYQYDLTTYKDLNDAPICLLYTKNKNILQMNAKEKKERRARKLKEFRNLN